MGAGRPPEAVLLYRTETWVNIEFREWLRGSRAAAALIAEKKPGRFWWSFLCSVRFCSDEDRTRTVRSRVWAIFNALGIQQERLC